MSRNIAVLILSSIIIITCISGRRKDGVLQNKNRPNIILIMADDLGYSDLGCYGGEVQTPNLDYLAANGVRFLNFYNTSRCCPTRASLLTGLYNHQAGIGEMTTDRNLPGYRGFLTPNTVTIAEVLKSAGYRTAMTGKWHVSNTIEQPTKEEQMKWLNHQATYPFFSPVKQYPVNRGFEKYFGNIWGVVDFFDPFSLVNGTKPVEKVPAGYYHTDAINDTAVSYIKEFSKGNKPFFLYVAHTAPHWPLHALPEDIKKYENTYKVGWDAIREARYQRMVKRRLIDTNYTKLSPRQRQESWNDNPNKEWDARAMAVHAAMIDRMDQGIGRIINALRNAGQLENTLIIFLSDNGASPEDCANYGPGFDRPDATRSGEKIIYPVNKEVLPGPENTYASIGPVWANVANTPYRYAKAESYEGGVRTPAIAFWPKGIRARGGYVVEVGHVMDFMPTFLQLANAKYPATYKGNAITPYSGISLVNAWKGIQISIMRNLYNEHFRARSIRDADWKLVSLAGDTTWRLYSIHDDESEMNDSAAARTDLVKNMAEQWWQWARSNKVLPKSKN